MIFDVIGQGWAIPITALIVSMGTLVLGGLTLKQKASAEYVTELEHRIAESEVHIKLQSEQLRICEEARTELQGRETDLMRRIINIEDKLEKRRAAPRKRKR